MTRTNCTRFTALLESAPQRWLLTWPAGGRWGILVGLAAVALLAGILPRSTLAQSEGGLYIAGYRFGFEQAAEEGLMRNPRNQRFFVLVLPPADAALSNALPKSATGVRDRVIAAGGVILVCQRDLDDGVIDAATLIPEVVAVRGFPPRGSQAMAPGERYFPDENRDSLPASNDALRRLRAACS
ncbi:MAG: hypothetical protein L6Q83_05930 [Gammaproteobacteria bacterium]|nr:hypothetical protein [Gammaproteobacteria bacterium]